jgi:hypothetical protein
MGASSSTLCRGASTPGRAARGIYAGRRILTGHTISFSDKRFVIDTSYLMVLCCVVLCCVVLCCVVLCCVVLCCVVLCWYRG